MDSDSSDSGASFERRQFLKRAGFLTAAAFAPPLLGACADGSGQGTGSSPSPVQGATSPSPSAATPLKIGVLNDRSAVFQVVGEYLDEGFELYLDENSRTLGGRDVEIVVQDTESNPEVGLRAARRLIESDEVDLLVGTISSAVALAIRDVVHESETPLVIWNAGANALTREQFSPFVFRTSYANSQSTRPAGQWAYDTVAQSGMYIMAADYVAGHEIVDGFMDSYTEAGGEILREDYPPFQATDDYQPWLTRVQQEDAEALFVFFAGGEAINFVQQYNSFGIGGNVPLLGHGGLTEVVLGAQGEAALGVQTVFLYAEALDIPRNREFVEAYSAKYDRLPNSFSVQAYDAAQLIDLALQGTDGSADDVERLIDSFESAGEIDSPSGAWHLDENHNPVRHWYIREPQEVDGTLQHVVIADLGVHGDVVG